MRTIIEVTQTECECIAFLTQQTRPYKIKATVEFKPAIGRQLLININPPLNSKSSEEMAYDGSRLPEDMVADWLMDILNPDQTLSKYDVISSNKTEHTINIS